jgi:hypothetical protein
VDANARPAGPLNDRFESFLIHRIFTVAQQDDGPHRFRSASGEHHECLFESIDQRRTAAADVGRVNGGGKHQSGGSVLRQRRKHITRSREVDDPNATRELADQPSCKQLLQSQPTGLDILGKHGVGSIEYEDSLESHPVIRAPSPVTESTPHEGNSQQPGSDSQDQGPRRPAP